MMSKNKNKAFVLPSTIFSLVVISLLSILIFSLVLTSNTQNKLLERESNAKLLETNIFYNFKNNESSDFDGIVVQKYVSSDDENVKAVIAKKGETTICFGVYDFGENTTICFQNTNYDFEIQEDQSLIFESENYTKI